MPGQGPDGKELWIGQAGRDHRRLLAGEGFGGFVESMLRGRLDAIYPLAHFTHVEVHFQYPLLTPYQFDHKSEIDLEAFADKAPALPEKYIFRHLLADGAGPVQGFAFLVMLHGLFNGLEIESVM